VIIGGALGKIVDSVVGDLIMPMLGAVIGKLDFSNLFLVLGNVPPVPAPRWTRRKKKSRCSCFCRRQLHHRGCQLCDSGLHHFYDGHANQPP
jgi:hypothetical protein